MLRYPTVLFDLDGTLIDSVRLILDSYHHTTRTHGLPMQSDDYWLAGLGTPLRTQFGPEAGDDPARMEMLIATYREYNLAHHDSQITAYPGVVDTVRALQASGARLGLVTSKNRPGAERGLRIIGLEGVMEVIVGADDVANPKPHPEPVFLAMERLGVGAEGAVFIGDSTHDMHAGRGAGVVTAAALWGPFAREVLEPTAPDHWLAQPTDVLELVLERRG